jgi:hypothetical protein
MKTRSLSTVDTGAVVMATHSTMIETCQQAMVHMADLETIISLCKNLAATARFLTKTQHLRTRGAEYQLQYVLLSTNESSVVF